MMKEYTKEEKIKLIDKINKIQRLEFNYKKENGKNHTNEEISYILNISIDNIIEIKEFIKNLNEEDKKLALNSNHHTKKDIIKAREIRKNKKVIKDLNSYMKDE